MSNPTVPNSRYQAVLDLVRTARVKAAGLTPDVKDPTNIGTVSIPVDPKADPKLQNVPPSEKNGPAKPTLETPSSATGSLQGAPAFNPESGNAKEVVSSPTDKLAAAGAKLAAAASALRGQPKQAAKAAAAPAATSPLITPDDVMASGGDIQKLLALGAERAAAAGITDQAQIAEQVQSDIQQALAMAGVAQEKAAGDTIANAMLHLPAHLKVAQVLDECEGGREMVHRFLKVAKGAEIADRLMADAESLLARQRVEAAAIADGEAQVDAMFKGASAEERDTLVKLATAHDFAIGRFEHLEGLAIQAKNTEAAQHAAMLKAAYVDGAANAAALDDTGAIPGTGEDISDEEILAVLQQMAEAGEISPEVFEQLATLLMGGGGEEEASLAEQDPMLAGAEAQAAGEAIPEEAIKAASVAKPLDLFMGLGRADVPDAVKAAAALLSNA